MHYCSLPGAIRGIAFHQFTAIMADREEYSYVRGYDARLRKIGSPRLLA